jgi:putative mRNA 3-end processing factor
MDIKRVGNGILIKYKNRKYAIDRVSKNTGADIFLVSHAHADHLPPGRGLKVIASEETVSLARTRGYKYFRLDIDKYRDIETYPSGHIIGSIAFMIEGKILYTGDVNVNDRLFLNGFRPPQADILIIEATYGDPKYRFGRFNKLIDLLLRRVSREILSGNNVILQAHPLGKPQLLTKIFDWYKHTYVTPNVYRYNIVSVNHNYLEDPGKVFNEEIEQPFILISGKGNKYIDNIISKHNNTKILTLSGWMVRYPERGLPVSDHSDYSELLQIVDKVSPREIYTIYGFKEKLATYLNKEGYNAKPI